MFARKPDPEDAALEQVIALALKNLDQYSIDSKEYSDAVASIAKLYALKTPPVPSRISPDTLAIVLGNLAGILVIVGAERSTILTSKAISFVMKAAR